jgi:hypothetical protein
VLAQDTTLNGSGCISAHPSGWLRRDDTYEARFQSCREGGFIDENGDPITPLDAAEAPESAEPVEAVEPLSEPVVESTEEPGGNGYGKGGKPK